MPALGGHPAWRPPGAAGRGWRRRPRAARPCRARRSLAASVGVEARTSATKSSSGVSTSWPMALTTGVTAPATARTSASLLNGRRSSKAPPPRVMTMTSTARSRVQLAQGGAHLGHGVGPLHRHLTDLEDDRGPAAAGVLDDVLLGGAAAAADQPDPAGQERERLLAVARRTGPRRPAPLEVLQPGEQLAHADGAHLPGVELQGAALGPERRLGLHHHPRALGRAAPAIASRVGDPHRHVEGHVDVGVAQGEVGGLGARPPGQLDHLALHPQGGHLLDVVGDLQAEQPDRPRLLGGGVGRLLRQRLRGWSRRSL